MNKSILLAICILLSSASLFAKKKVALYGVAFYNLENLFDTERNEEINDEEFTPSGANNWTTAKYWKKQNNLAYVIDKLAKHYCPTGIAILGVAEIENRKVLEDLVGTDLLKKSNYQIVHYDSPDKRGIDVGL